MLCPLKLAGLSLVEQMQREVDTTCECEKSNCVWWDEDTCIIVRIASILAAK